MITTKDLNSIDKEFKSFDFHAILSKILKLNSYKNWKNQASYGFFMLSKEDRKVIGKGNIAILLKYNLLIGDCLQIKIDKFSDRIFITDEISTKSSIRVHPYKDEGVDIYNYIKKLKIDSWADVLIDPACGCGHHGVNFSKSIDQVFSFDVNRRCLVMSRINAKLHKVSNIRHIENNICRSFPKICLSRNDNILITVNMPFGIFPYKYSSKSLSQDGKENDASYLSICALNQLNKFLYKYSNYRIIFLYCSVGNLKKNKWKIVEEANKIFSKCEISNTIISGDKLLRINGKKIESNPMDIRKLSKKANCRVTFTDEERENVKENYKKISEKLFNQGDTHLVYGLIDIEKVHGN